MEEKSLQQRLDHARHTVGGDPWAKFIDICIDEVEERYAKVSILPEARHLNALGMVHGAVFYALADQAYAVASNTAPSPAVLIEANLNILSAGKPGVRLCAEARARDVKHKLTTWDVEIKDPDGKLLAVSRGITYSL